MTPTVVFGLVNGETTTIGYPMEPDSEDLQTIRDANVAELNDHSTAMRNWMDSMPVDQQPFFIHVMQADHLWAQHSDSPPVWVSCPEYPLLEQALADHFSARGATVAIGQPA